MDAPVSDGWPTLLEFLRTWVFIPALAAFGWLWNEIRRVKREQQEQLNRIETSVTTLAATMAKHQIDDLTNFASKADLQILRNDVLAMRQDLGDRIDRLGDLIVKSR